MNARPHNPTAPRLPWSIGEVKRLREHYPLGVDVCMRILPNRSRSAIHVKAQALKLRTRVRGGGRVPYAHTPEIDEAIRATRAAGTSTLRELALRVGRPSWWISKRAIALGVSLPAGREPNWSEAELTLLHNTAHMTPTAACVVFRRHGYARTECALVLRRKLERARPDATGHYSANALAKLVGYEVHTVLRWIRAHGLPAKQRGTTAEHDHWLIRDRDFRAWLIANPLRLDLRKVPVASHAWLIELLGRGGTAIARVDAPNRTKPATTPAELRSAA
jgi:hypothetical protein